MGDPQERPTVSKEFVAGIIVGEGYFGLTVNKMPRLRTQWGFKITPAFSVQMNDTESMEAIIQAFRDWGLAFHVSEQKGALRIDATGHKRVARVIECFRPLLTGDKARAADIVGRLVTLRLSKPMNTPYGEEELELVAQIRRVNAQRGTAITAAELKELHSRKRYNRTECIHGHPLTPENTYREGGRRRCRKCGAARQDAYRARRSESSETARSAPV